MELAASTTVVREVVAGLTKAHVVERDVAVTKGYGGVDKTSR